MPLDVAAVRADFPALRAGLAHFDGPGGTQTPFQVVDAIAGALRSPLANRGSGNEAQRNAERIVRDARQAMADLTNADANGVVFGRSATQLTFDLSRALARTWRPSDEVIVTRLDHDANIRPWLIAADRAGCEVRWADFDPGSAELRIDQVDRLLSNRTKLVAVTGASNLIGTRPDLPALSAAAHAVGALLHVDAVHLAAHTLLDLPGVGADLMVCSPYKFLGPHLGVLVAAPTVLEGLRADKLLPSPDRVPERFELGTLPYELLAGTTAAVNYLADLAGSDPQLNRRQRLSVSFELVDEHEGALRQEVEAGLAEQNAVVYSRARNRTSTILFDVPGRRAADVADHLARLKINAPAGSFYAIETSRHLGLGDGGAVRVGLAPYNDTDEVDRLLAGLSALRAG